MHHLKHLLVIIAALVAVWASVSETILITKKQIHVSSPFAIQTNISIPQFSFRDVVAFENSVLLLGHSYLNAFFYKFVTTDDGLEVSARYVFPGFLNANLDVMQASKSFYFVYIMDDAGWQIMEMSKSDLSIIRNQTLKVDINRGHGFIAEKLNSIFFPYEQYPTTGNQLQRISLDTLSGSGPVVNVDKFGIVMNKFLHPDQSKLYFTMMGLHERRVVNWTIVEYDLVNNAVMRSYTSQNLTTAPWASSFIPVPPYKIVTTYNDVSNVKFGVGIFDIESFQPQDSVLIQDPVLENQQYCDKVVATSKFVYFSTGRNVRPFYTYLWRMPVDALEQSSLQMVNATVPGSFFMNNLVANEHGAYYNFREDVLYKTN